MSFDRLFDTSVVPDWRTAGTVTLTGSGFLAVGDPCYGSLTPVGSSLPAGTWRWDIREADRNPRIWEVRLVLDGQQVDDDWSWTDAYGIACDHPAEGAEVIDHLGVDTGTIAWELHGHLADPPSRRLSYDDMLALALGRQQLHANNSVLITSTGFGDGGYPLAVRHVDGQVVEVRTCYVTPDPEPIDAGDFAELLPGAFVDAPEIYGDIDLHLIRTDYTSFDPARDKEPQTNTYERVDSVSITDASGRTRRLRTRGVEDFDAESCAPLTVASLWHLWRWLPEDGRLQVTAAHYEGPPVRSERDETGFITRYTDTEVRVRLRDPRPVPGRSAA